MVLKVTTSNLLPILTNSLRFSVSIAIIRLVGSKRIWKNTIEKALTRQASSFIAKNDIYSNKKVWYNSQKLSILPTTERTAQILGLGQSDLIYLGRTVGKAPAVFTIVIFFASLSHAYIDHGIIIGRHTVGTKHNKKYREQKNSNSHSNQLLSTIGPRTGKYRPPSQSDVGSPPCADQRSLSIYCPH